MTDVQDFRAFPQSLFNEIECGLVVCDCHGVIHYANQTAERELGRTRLLMCQERHLRSTPDAGGGLEHAILQAAQRGRRSLITLVAHGDRLMVSVQPLSAAAVQVTQVLVMLGRREPCSPLGLELLASSYGLTLAETRVLAALTHKATPREIAAQNAVAMSTVRTQISSIRAKLDVRNIEGVLLRAAEVPPMASALRMAHESVLPATRPAPNLLAAA